MTTRANFTVAAWASILNAIALIPVVAVTVALAFFPENRPLQIANDVLTFVSAGLAIYVLLALKRLLHVYAFDAADFVLALLVGGIVAGAIVDIAGGLMSQAEVAAGVQLFFGVVMGVISAVLGVKLLQTVSLLPGPIKQFAYLTIASGVSLATIILIPIGVLASLAGDIALALVFLRASEAPVAVTVDNV